nr:DUF5412 family protein [Polycladospora coralii]
MISFFAVIGTLILFVGGVYFFLDVLIFGGTETEYLSPSGKYIVTLEENGGFAGSSDCWVIGTVAETKFIFNVNKRVIFREENQCFGEMKWIAEDQIIINGIKLDVIKDYYEGDRKDRETQYE